MKKIIMLAVMALLLAPVFSMSSLPAQAQTDDPDSLLWGGQQQNVNSEIGLGDQDPRVIIAKIINVALGFLGIVAVVLILLGGFKWMTAAGNEDKITEARGILIAGVVGLVIILAAWGIAKFVVDALYNATRG